MSDPWGSYFVSLFETLSDVICLTKVRTHLNPFLDSNLGVVFQHVPGRAILKENKRGLHESSFFEMGDTQFSSLFELIVAPFL